MAYRDVVQIVSGFAPADEIKKAVATSIAAQTYVGAALDGTWGRPPFSTVGTRAAKRRLTVTTSAAALAYNVTDPIVFYGAGDAAGAAVYLTNTNGNETVQTTHWLENVAAVYVPAQLLGTGQFQFGIGDVVFEEGEVARIYAGAAGTYKIQTVGGDRDLVMAVGEYADLAIVGVQRSNATFPLSIYLA